MALSLSLSPTYADTNTTKATEKKIEINDQDKLKEALKTLESDLKNNKIENNMTIAKDYNTVGFYSNKTGQTKDALKYYKKAVKIIDDQKKPYSKIKTIYYNNLATAYENNNKLSEALKYYIKALVIYKEKLPAEHPYIASTSSDIGSIYEKMGNTDKALEYQLEALKIRQKSLRPTNHPDVMYSYEKVASLYDKKGDYKEALAYGKELMELLSLNDKDSRKNLQAKLDDLQKKIDSQKMDKTQK